MFEYYRDFKLKNICSEKYRHLFYVLFWPVYILMFVLTEKYIVPKYVMYCKLDSIIPFYEFFVIPYFLWYGCLAFVSLYALFFDVPTFKKFYKFLCITSAISVALFIIFPNEQNLRPQVFEHSNFFVDLMKGIYKADTNTNVCPSIHVVFSLGMLFSLWNSKHFANAKSRVVMSVIAFFICISTVFLKQHSCIDIVAGVLLSFAVYPFIFMKKGKHNLENAEKEKVLKKDKIFVDK